MAIDEILDEHEQGERVRQWLRENALGLVGGIVLGLGAIGGWKWWEHQAHQKKLDQADAYSAAVEAVDAGDPAASQKVAALPEGALAALAAFELAKSQSDAGKTEDAIATLRGVRVADPALQSIANQRLARLLIESTKAEEALALLASGEGPAELELRGDAEYALGRRDDARASYEKALAGVDVGSPHRRMLELKLIEVGGKPAGTEAES